MKFPLLVTIHVVTILCNRGNFVLKTVTLEDTHLIWLTQAAEVSLTSDKRFNIFKHRKRTVDIVPYLLHCMYVRKESFNGQYQQEEWSQPAKHIECTHARVSETDLKKPFLLMQNSYQYHPWYSNSIILTEYIQIKALIFLYNLTSMTVRIFMRILAGHWPAEVSFIT